MPILIIVEFTIIVSTIPTFQPELIPLFFHIDSLQEFRIGSNFSMPPILSLSQKLKVVEKIAMKNSLWLPTVKVNLIKMSLLLGIHSGLNMTNQ
jgi:hypothetical protein